MTAQVIVAGITFVLGQAVAFGLIPAATSTNVVSVAPIVVGVAFAIAAAVHSFVAVLSERKVTPVAGPQAVVTGPDGTSSLEPLVPLSLAAVVTPNDAGIDDPSDDYRDIDPAAQSRPA